MNREQLESEIKLLEKRIAEGCHFMDRMLWREDYDKADDAYESLKEFERELKRKKTILENITNVE